MFEFLKNLFKSPEPEIVQRIEPVIEKPVEQPKKALSPKEIATQANEPWVSIVNISFDDPENPNSVGTFEFDWNDRFIVVLIRLGYQLKSTDTDAEIVDRWFQNVCRNVAMELYEQHEANFPEHDTDDFVNQGHILHTRIDNKLSQAQ